MEMVAAAADGAARQEGRQIARLADPIWICCETSAHHGTGKITTTTTHEVTAMAANRSTRAEASEQRLQRESA